MKKILIIAAALSLIISCASVSKKQKDSADFTVTIEQNGVVKEIIDNTVSLGRGEFFMIFTFPAPDSLYVNASFDSETFDLVKLNTPVEKIAGFSSTAMAEDLFNQDETLMISRLSPSYWHYAGEKDHRFTSVEVFKSGIVCRRKISFIADVDGKKNREPLKSIKNDFLYLSFMKLEWNRDFTGRIESGRKWLRIDFTDMVKEPVK